MTTPFHIYALSDELRGAFRQGRYLILGFDIDLDESRLKMLDTAMTTTRIPSPTQSTKFMDISYLTNDASRMLSHPRA